MAAPAPPVDPGPSIQWVKHPEYTSALVDQLALVSTQDNQHHLVWTGTARKSHEFKLSREHVLDHVTAAVFSTGGEPGRAKKQRDSILRRIQACVHLPIPSSSSPRAPPGESAPNEAPSTASLAPTSPSASPRR